MGTFDTSPFLGSLTGKAIDSDSTAGGASVSLLELLQFKTEFVKATPAVQFEYIDVTFGGSANADTDIRTTLFPLDPEGIDYLVVRKDRACDIYHDQSGTRKPWGTGYVILRSTAALARVRLLLMIRRQ